MSVCWCMGVANYFKCEHAQFFHLGNKFDACMSLEDTSKHCSRMLGSLSQRRQGQVIKSDI